MGDGGGGIADAGVEVDEVGREAEGGEAGGVGTVAGADVEQPAGPRGVGEGADDGDDFGDVAEPECGFGRGSGEG